MSGASQPASSIRCLISGTAAAASGTLTVTRTISDPGFGQLDDLLRGARASAVSVIVIDWTTTGAPPPTWTRPDLDANGLVKLHRHTSTIVPASAEVSESEQVDSRIRAPARREMLNY